VPKESNIKITEAQKKEMPRRIGVNDDDDADAVDELVRTFFSPRNVLTRTTGQDEKRKQRETATASWSLGWFDER
jgi:hypothetical protein